MAFRIAAIVLVILAIVGGVLGYLSINEVTVGPVFVGIGAILAVFARLAQAEYHQAQQMGRLKAIHFMIRDEIDRTSLVGSRGREESLVGEEDDDA